MYCKNCGAEVAGGGNFCPYCGQALTEATPAVSLLNKAAATANFQNMYSLVLVSCGSCDKVTTGDLLEDIFGYTDAESTSLINMAPVVVGERLSATEAQTVAQLLTEYGVQVSITNQQDQYVDLTSNAVSSVFDNSGNLIASAAAIIGALTVSNRISSYRRFKKPSLLERIFHVGYRPAPPAYRRNFRPRLNPMPAEPRRTIRTPQPTRPQGHAAPAQNHRAASQPNRGAQSSHGGHGGPQGGGPGRR